MMKLSRLMLAAVAVCGTSAVMAQSSVTIYGRVNTTIEHRKTGKESVTGMYNNSSRIGFKGVEDLGNGLKAGFQLEAGFGSDDGSGPLTFARQSEVNLSGNFGMVRLGNFYPESYYATSDYIGMHNHETGSSSDALYYDAAWLGDNGTGTGNKVAYRTPTFNNFWAEGSVSFHEKAKDPAKPNEVRKNAYDLAANYNNGPLSLGAGYSYWNSNYQAALRGLYTFGQFTVGAYYQRNKDDNDRLGTGAGSRNNFRLSGMYVLNASEFHVNVGRANSWSKVADSSATQWTLGYNYNLSKRTKVYTYYTKVNNKKGADYMTGTPGDDFSSFALGVRHNF
ncbi:MAG: porin [Burkholderiales bacterium]|nr:porin [Burkholderiales bacterium]